MKTVPILSPLELAIVGLLRDQPRSGYELRKALGSSPGAVYPAVRRLAAAGVTEAKPDTSTGRRKEVMHLTAYGRRALRAGLDKPSAADVRRDPDAVARRLAFLDGTAAAAFLLEYARAASEASSEWKNGRGLFAEYQADVFASRARWAAKTARRITKRS